MATESDIKKYMNSYVENKGTLLSGWWNPDHAARIALGESKLVNSFNGDGTKFAVAVISNKALDNAVHNTIKTSSPRLSGKNKVNETLFEIGNRNLDIKDGTVGNSSGRFTARSIGDDNVVAVTTATNMINDIADKLAGYAVSKDPKAPKAHSIKSIQTDIKNARRAIRAIEHGYNGCYYSDNSNKRTMIKKIVDSNINKLDDYTKEMSKIFKYS